MQFRKKPVVIEAFQIGSGRFYPDWLHDAITANIVITHGKPNGDTSKEPFNSAEIHTLEGVMNADHGDWIIQGVRGELYPCKPDIFAATYEAAGGQPNPLFYGIDLAENGVRMVRDAALEEAAEEADHWQSINLSHKCGSYIAGVIRALKSQPAKQDADKVSAQPSRAQLIEALHKIKLRLHFIGWPAESMWNIGTEEKPRWVPDWRYECQLIDHLLHGSPITTNEKPTDTVPANQIPAAQPDPAMAGDEVVAYRIIAANTGKLAQVVLALDFGDIGEYRPQHVVPLIEARKRFQPAGGEDALLRIELAAANATISHLSVLADRWLALRDVPDDLLGAVGIPCVALPSGFKSGDYLNGEHADQAVARLITARAQQGGQS